MLTFLSELNSEGLLWVHLVDVLIRITAVLALGCCIGMCLYRQSAAFRHGWWLTTLLAVSCVPVASTVLPNWGPANPLLSRIEPASVDEKSVALDPAMQSTVLTDAVFPIAEDLQTARTRQQRERRTTLPGPIAGMNESIEITNGAVAANTKPTKETARGESRQFGITAWLVGLWFVGCVSILLQIAIGLSRMSRILKGSKQITEQRWRSLAAEVMSKLGFRRNIALQESTNEFGPLTGGLIDPFVLLPSGCDKWPTDLKQVVLLHELAHVKRRDVLSLWWSRLVGATLWFHPLVWLVIRQLRIERERACDDLVLAAGTRPSTYSQHLVEIASAYRCPGWIATTAMTMAAGKSQLESRVRCVLDDNQNRRGMTTRAAVVTVLLSVGIATTVATAGRVIVRDAAGKTFATLEIPEGGSATIETDGKPVSQWRSKDDIKGMVIPGSEWHQWGGTAHRNNVSSATQLPNKWNVKTGENILWSTDLGSQTYGTPVIANGKIFIGTNNGHGYVKRFPKETDLGCLICFDVETGKFLWQHSNKKLATGRVHDWPLQGVVSTPVVKGNRLYYLTNRAVVTCLDTEGMRDGDAGPFRDEHIGDDEADVVWQYDLMKELGVSPKSISGCSPTTDGKRLYVLTSNGTDESYINTPSPNAPNFVCFDLKTGKLLWSAKASFAARDCQWSGPSVGTFVDRDGNSQTNVMFPGSDGWLYSFDPKGDGHGKAKLLWKFDCNPKDAKFVLGGRGRKNLHVSMPVIYNGLVYVATGRNPEQGEGDADLWCIDLKRSTHGPDISEFIVTDQDGNPLPVGVNSHFDKSKGHTKRPNPNSGVVWHYGATDLDGDNQTEFEETFHRTWGSPVIHNGLLVVADYSGLVHCLSADKGKLYWTYDLYAACWGSPLIADGRIFVGDEDGEITILNLGTTLKLNGELNCENSIYSTPVAVGNTLFVVTKSKLLAIRKILNPAPISKKSDDESNTEKRVRARARATATARAEAWMAAQKQTDLKKKLNAIEKGFRKSAPTSDAVRPKIPSNQSGSLQLPLTKTAWASVRNDERQRGVATCELPENLGLRWKLPTPDGWVSSVTIVGNHVYAPSLSGYLYCVELNTGKIVWKYRSQANLDPKKFAAGFRSTPLVTADTVYVGDEDGVFHAIERATGKRKWVLTTGAEIAGSAAAVGDRIVVGSHDSYLYCMKPDGNLIWKFQTGDRINCSPSIVNHYAFVAGCDKHLRVIDIRSGEELNDIPFNTYLIASPAIVDEKLYMGTYAGGVVAVNWKTHEIIWRYQDEKQEFPYHASVSVTDSRIFVGGHDKQFHCINRATGQLLWKFQTRAHINSSSVVVGDRVFFGSDDGNIYGLQTSDGKEVWKYHAGKKITAGVAVGEGYLVVGEDGPNGILYCFGARD